MTQPKFPAGPSSHASSADAAQLAGGVSDSAPGLFFRWIRRVTGRRAAAGTATLHDDARRRRQDHAATNLALDALDTLSAEQAIAVIRTHLTARQDVTEAQLQAFANHIGRVAHEIGREAQGIWQEGRPE